MFLICCKFQPNYRHLSGSNAANWHFTRGAWVVVSCSPISVPHQPVKAMHFAREVVVMCPTPRRRGTRVSPFKLLKEYQHAQRIAERIEGENLFWQRNRCA